MPAISTLIKPVSGKCNLRCQYCFYMDEAENRQQADFGIMSLETLEEIVKKALQFAEGQATFCFQGGEPTIRGLDFYRALIELETKYNVNGVQIDNSIQTNGILIDEEWAQFLHDNDFLVGLSLDGPKDIHDSFRPNLQGEGSYDRVMKTAKILEKYDVKFNILLTVTSAVAEKPGKVYAFFKKCGFAYLQFMPCIDPYAQKRGEESFSLTPPEFAHFLRVFYDRWQEDLLNGKYISVRYFDNLIRMYMGIPPEACSMRGMCSCQFVFEADGSCYPCDFYVSESWCMGNIQDHDFHSLYQSEAAAKFLRTGSQLPASCQKCKWRGICRGGCRRDREDNITKLQGDNYFCKAYDNFFDYAVPKMAAAARYVAEHSRKQDIHQE